MSTNVFIKAFTTFNTILRLYDLSDELGETVMYYDANSIIYIDYGINIIETDCMLIITGHTLFTTNKKKSIDTKY